MVNENNGFLGNNQNLAQDLPKKEPELAWISKEYVPEKSTKWYISLIIVTVIASGLVYVGTKDLISTFVLIACGLLVLGYSLKKPKNIEYRIRNNELIIQNRTYFLGNFRAFSVYKKANSENLMLIPLKRFVPRVYISLDREISQNVINTINQVIPAIKYSQDFIERIDDIIRF